MALERLRASLVGTAVMASSWFSAGTGHDLFAQELEPTEFASVLADEPVPPDPVTPQSAAAGYANPCCPNGSAQQGEMAQSNGTPAQFADYGEEQLGVNQTSVAVAGTGLAAVGGGPAAGATVVNGLISPGLLTAANVESPFALNRVFFNYSYYDQFQVTSTTFNGAGLPVTSRGAGFNLNRFDIGFEKTVLRGLGSFYVRAPFLFAANNVTGQSINGIGDLNVGFKAMLAGSVRTGNVLSAGLTVITPTGQPGQFTQVTSPAGVAAPVTTSINPTFLQPWVAGQLTWERWYVQQFVGVLTPLTNQIVTSVNNNVAVGYRMYNCSCPSRWISSITPLLNAQVLVPVQGSGAPPPPAGTGTGFPISFPTQMFLTEGCQVGLGPRLSVFSGLSQPVVGPKAYTIGATFGASLLY